MFSPLRILVCGGRDFRDKAHAFSCLDDIASRHRILCVIHGGASGADYLAGRWAQERGVPVEEYKADWHAHGRAAGPIRNQEMIELGRPNYVVAFRGGRGTADMTRRARTAGILVKEAG